MKQTIKQYGSAWIRRGMIACGLGPIVLAIVYLILHRTAGLETLTVAEVCRGIFSLSALAFVAGGMNILYRIERLPLAVAILIHGITLYLGYLATYLLNGWLGDGRTPILIFTAIFVFGYLLIWAVIYAVTRRRTRQLNALLTHRQNP